MNYFQNLKHTFKRVMNPSNQMVVYKPKRKKKSRTNKTNPSPSAIIYNGPLKVPKALTNNDTDVFQFNYIGTMSTNSSGVLAPVIDAYAQASSSPDWTNISAAWAEYRILSMQFEAKPWNKYNQPTNQDLAPIYVVTDRSQSNALTSLNDVMGYSSAKIYPPSSELYESIKMAGTDEASFITTTSTPPFASRMYIKLFSNGNAPVVKALYDYMTRILVQYRGRR